MVFRFLLLLLFTGYFLHAQDLLPKREFRSVWIASVSNIDWPTSKNLTPAQQRAEFISILDKHALNKINCVVVQIRPSCDAFYQSSIEPWSEWLTGTQGTPPNPFYDPLTFMIEETHKRGMEFHAWFNPYRAVMSSSASVHSTHVSKKHPDWVRSYGQYKWLDPGLPQVRDYSLSVITDVIKRYDIDGVHFDDYFYPYPIAGTDFPDDSTFIRYPRGFTNKSDWRRDNINIFLQSVYDTIRCMRKHVKFGISPFGIWRNQSTDPLGSATSGFQAYDQQFADSRKWVQMGWLDYIAPQVYWNIGYAPAKYEVLVPWWANNSFQRHLYIGMAAYKINSSTQDTLWFNPTQMPTQLRLNRNTPNVRGQIFFSSKSITNNPLGFQDSLRQKLFKYPALIPEMPWLDSIAPNEPASVSTVKDSTRITISWSTPPAASDGDLPYYYLVYKFPNQDSVDFSDLKYLYKRLKSDSLKLVDSRPAGSQNEVIYGLTALDRLHNETDPIIIRVDLTRMDKEPVDVKQIRLYENYPNPFYVTTTIEYYLPRPSQVKIEIVNLLGEVMQVPVNGESAAGRHSVEISAASPSGPLAPGIYFYRLKAGNSMLSGKMIILK
ncbi:MAG: family 10 glycosylhydrolase [Ignavibacteriaceae bacterium]|nr:family 10 glycosylhydrolase [Ignavibacteriaceae bacterium]